MYPKEHDAAFEKCVVEENDVTKCPWCVVKHNNRAQCPNLYTFLHRYTFYLKKTYCVNVLKD